MPFPAADKPLKYVILEFDQPIEREHLANISESFADASNPRMISIHRAAVDAKGNYEMLIEDEDD